MIFRKFHILLICLLITGFLTAETDIAYKIGAQDLLEINVFNVPELNKTVRVSEDGTINLALIGKIMVAGLTRFEVETKLATFLKKKYLKDPQVTVFIKEYKSKKVSVIGAVKSPGNYQIAGNMSLMEAISLAGGLSGDVSGRAIIIRKYKNGKSGSLIINLEELMLEGNPSLNIPLQPGDIINVPVEKFLSIYIFGQVKNPGMIKIRQDNDVTLLKAIAAAGGFTDRARKASVLVKRTVNGVEKKYTLNVKKILKGKAKNFLLKDNDIVHVPESIF